MSKKKYTVEEDVIPMASEPAPAYTAAASQQQTFHPAPPFIHDEEADESFIMDVTKELGARRAEWGRKNFDRLLAEANQIYGCDADGLMTVEQYFGKLWYIVEKGYEAIPG